MKTVWKLPLVPAEGKASLFPLKMPKGAKVLMVGADPEGQECIWFEFERRNAEILVDRVLEIFGTDHLIPPLSTHILSFKSGPFMWHLYDHGEIVRPLGAH